jgi:hypothetical protein
MVGFATWKARGRFQKLGLHGSWQTVTSCLALRIHIRTAAHCFVAWVDLAPFFGV